MAKSRKQRRTLIGIEFHDSEIRVIETQSSGGSPVVVAAGSVPMPPKSIVEGEVVRGDAVAFALKKLLDRIGVTSRDAVLGIPVAGYTTRSLKIPDTPSEEQALLIEGEVRHFDIVRSADGAYDYFQLESPDTSELDMILMAAEGHITASLRSVAEKVNLDVVALEPVTIGMIRAGVFGAKGADGLFLALGGAGTEAAIIQGGKLRLYRRIELGTNALFSAIVEPGAVIDHTASRDDEEQLVAEPKKELRHGPADTLCVEIRRTLEYYSREFSDAPPLPGIRLLVEESVAEEFADYLATAVKTDVQLIRPSGFVGATDAVTRELSGDGTFRYVAAFGLGLRYPDSPAPPVPALDLYSRERSMADMESKRRTMAGSLVVAIAAVLLGMTGMYIIGGKIKALDLQVAQLHRDADALRAKQAATIQGDREVMEQIDYFSSAGIPAVWFVDNMASNLDSSLGISEIRFDEAGTVFVRGEAKQEQALIETVRSFQQSPNLGTAYISSFERINASSGDTAIRFEIKLVRPAGGGPR